MYKHKDGSIRWWRVVATILIVAALGVGIYFGIRALVNNAEAEAAEAAEPDHAAGTEVDSAEFTLEADEEAWVLPGWVVSGDIEVWVNGDEDEAGYWQPLYDTGPDSENTGLITVFTTSAKIRAPYGAWAGVNANVSAIRSRMLCCGCGLTDGCEDVQTVTWPE